jgi:Tol biopolymer transport system component
MKIIVLFLVLSLTALASCRVSGSKGGDKQNKPAIPGKIVFSAKDSAGIFQIYTMKANGTNIKQLTHFGPEGGGYMPSWSPDGSQIVFSTTLHSSSSGFSLYIMNADGFNKHPMHKRKDSPIPTPGNNAQWSPDGSKIAFDLCVMCQVHINIEIFVYDFENNSVTQITHTSYPVSNQYPTWSSDSKKIAFATDRDYIDADSARYRQDLYVINADGTHLQRLTHSGKATRPKWSPDGKKIAYIWNIHVNTAYIYNMKSNKIRKLNTGLEFSGVIGWSADSEDLLIGGRKTKNSQPELRLINNEMSPPIVLQILKLNKKTTGTDDDWYNNR